VRVEERTSPLRIPAFEAVARASRLRAERSSPGENGWSARSHRLGQSERRQSGSPKVRRGSARASSSPSSSRTAGNVRAQIGSPEVDSEAGRQDPRHPTILAIRDRVVQGELKLILEPTSSQTSRCIS